MAIENGAPESATFNPTVTTHTVANGQVGPGPEMNKPSVSKTIAKMGWSTAPLDTFLRNINTGKTNSDKYEFFSVMARGVKCKAGAQAEIKTDSTATITLSEGWHALSKDGNLLVPSMNVAGGVASAAPDGIAPHPLVVHIVAINYVDHTITVVGVNGAGTIPAETELYRMASAKDQDAAMSEDPQATPTKDYNFCQRNLCTISENAYQALQEKEVEYGLKEFKEQAVLDFRYQAEVSSLFGGRAILGENFLDPVTQKRKLHMRGLTDFNIQSIVQSTEDIELFLNRAMEALYSVNNGSEERLLLWGAGFATKLANSKSWTKQLEAKNTEIKWGVRWKLIESQFGLLRCVMDPALSLLGPYTNTAIVVDPNNIRHIEQVAMFERELDLKSAGIRNTKDILLEESITLEVTNPTTHGMLILK